MQLPTVDIAVVCLAASSLASTAATTDSGVCGLTVTCLQNATTVRACLANETADFTLVGSSLQSCKDVSYYFSQGQPWPINDKALFCAADSVCGKLVPYLRNTAYLSDVCEAFAPFADTVVANRSNNLPATMDCWVNSG